MHKYGILFKIRRGRFFDSSPLFFGVFIMSADLKNWMARLPDTVSAAAVSIPGTHNSSTKHIPLGLVCCCQNTSITEQLNFGIRMLDIRLELCSEGFKAVHSIIDCRKSRFGGRLYFDTIFSDITSFLKMNPSEAVFMLLSEDDRNDLNLPFFDMFYQRYIMPHRDVWFCENRIPSVYECRGRIVLMRRAGLGTDSSGYDDKNTGLNLTSWCNMGNKKEHSSLVLEIKSVESGESGESVDFAEVQDRYMHSPRSKWRDVMLPALERAGAFNGRLRLNYASTAGGFFMPVFNARYINKQLLSYRFIKGRYYGWFSVDFATPRLCERIIALNFQDFEHCL
jgi:hypothetical protein